jgi:hypothetical protein
MTVSRPEAGPGTRIEAQAEAAARSRNGHGRERRPAARSRIEAAAAANAAAAAAAQAAGEAMGELYGNRLIAVLDAEGIGGDLSDDDRDAILHMVRRLSAPAPLPHREPGGTGAHPAVRL